MHYAYLGLIKKHMHIIIIALIKLINNKDNKLFIIIAFIL